MPGDSARGAPSGAPLGRADEAQALQRFVEAVVDPGERRFLLLSGEAGIGKTVLWWWAIGRARELGTTVLVARPAAVRALAFEGVGDLFAEPLAPASPLSPASRAALDAALPKPVSSREATGDAVDAATVTRGCIDAVRVLAKSGPVLIAIDDLPYLDDASARVVQQLSRRAGHAGVAVLATARGEFSGSDSSRGASAPCWWDEVADIVTVRGVPDEALTTVITARRGRPLPRPILRRVLRTSRGNPMLAIELVRSLDRGETSMEVDGVAKVPSTLRHLMASRIDHLRAPVRSVLEVVSETSAPTAGLVDEVVAGTPSGAIEEAIDLGLIEATRGRLRVTHPLVASTVRATTPPARRREIHRRLAEAFDNVEHRALHLSMAVVVPDREVADLLVQASRHAWSRGAADEAAAFAEHAVRLRPGDDPARADTVMIAADLAFEAGDARRSVELIESALGERWSSIQGVPGSQPFPAQVPDGPAAALLLRLARAKGLTEGFRVSAKILTLLLDEPLRRTTARAPLPGDLRVRVLLELASALNQFDVRGALPVCLRAVTEAEAVGDGQLTEGALDALASAHTLLASPEASGVVRAEFATVEQSAVRLRDTDPPPPQLLRRGLGVSMRLKSAGHLEAARTVLQQLSTHIELEGGEGALPPVLLQLGEIACLQAQLERADDLVTQCRQVVNRSGQQGVAAQLDYVRAFAAGLRGQVDEATEAASTALRVGVEVQDGRHQARAARVLGQLALARSDWQAAAEILLPALRLSEACGFREPGFLRLDVDAVEALTGSGDLDAAQRLSADLDGRARLPWARAAADHARAIVHSAQGRLAEAAAEAEAAARAFADLGHPVDAARALLLHAVVSRRQRRRAVSRGLLEQASQVLDGHGVRLWNERLAAQLRLLGEPITPPGDLTPSEQRLAQAVAQGMSNREAAAALHISVKTVEAHLSHIFTKLSIRSRSELVAVIVRTGRERD